MPEARCKKCSKHKEEVGVLIPYKGEYLCDMCVLEINREALKSFGYGPNTKFAFEPADEDLPEAENPEAAEDEDEKAPEWSPLHPIDDDTIERIMEKAAASAAAEKKDLTKEYFDPEAVALLPKSIAEQFCMIPIRREGQGLIVAVSDPDDEEALQEARYFTGLELNVVIADADEIEDAIEKYYEA